MTKYQIYTTDKNDKLLHAGVHTLGHISHRTIKKLERKWLAWRKIYINEHPGEYPLKEDADLLPRYVTIFPIGAPRSAQKFTITFS